MHQGKFYGSVIGIVRVVKSDVNSRNVLRLSAEIVFPDCSHQREKVGLVRIARIEPSSALDRLAQDRLGHVGGQPVVSSAVGDAGLATCYADA